METIPSTEFAFMLTMSLKNIPAYWYQFAPLTSLVLAISICFRNDLASMNFTGYSHLASQGEEEGCTTPVTY